jgi:hypothetical protein
LPINVASALKLMASELIDFSVDLSIPAANAPGLNPKVMKAAATNVISIFFIGSPSFLPIVFLGNYSKTSKVNHHNLDRNRNHVLQALLRLYPTANTVFPHQEFYGETLYGQSGSSQVSLL